MDKQQKQQEDTKHEHVSPMETEMRQRVETSAEIPVIRSSTPRPLKVGPGFHIAEQDQTKEVSFFPASAPAAPPLPEELGDKAKLSPEGPSSLPSAQGTPEAKSEPDEEQEFVWLFEYALEMDSTLLNSPECLDGQALLYGPAVLRGYSIQFGTITGDFGSLTGNGRTIATIVPGAGTHAEVWGVLYRVPRSLTISTDEELSPLDTAHGAVSPHHLFQPVKAVVYEAYRGRNISCITYIATEHVRQHLRLLTPSSSDGNALFVQRVAAIARRQRLPESYVKRAFAPIEVPTTEGMRSRERPFMRAPLPVTRLDREKHSAVKGVPSTTGVQVAQVPYPRAEAVPSLSYEVLPWLLIFAGYLSLLFLFILIFAFCQGGDFDNTLLAGNLTLLGVPWLVFVYGLLGGCISCIISLGRVAMRSETTLMALNRSMVVIVTWFARPFIGAVLGLLMYLFLNSGIFMFESMLATHPDMVLLCAALAGLCEHRLFLWKIHE